MEGSGGIPISPLRTLQTTRNPLKTATVGARRPRRGATPDNPAKKCKHSFPRLGLLFWLLSDRTFFAGYFSPEFIRPTQPRGKSPLCYFALGKRSQGWGEKYKGAFGEPPWAQSWRVSGANLKGRQNLFCAPEPQPGEAEDGAKNTREPWGTAVGAELEGERSEPEGAAKFILRPGTPARRSRGWGEKYKGALENRRGRKHTREPWRTAGGANTQGSLGKRRGRKHTQGNL
jgi:hypothetical protein